MAARPKNALTDDELTGLREQLAAGRRPRVQLSGAQFTGSTGTVVRIGDPATAGSDYVTVRVKVNGATDELPFAPSELSLPGKATTKASSGGRPARQSGRRAGTAASSAPAAVAQVAQRAPVSGPSPVAAQPSSAAAQPVSATVPPLAAPTARATPTAQPTRKAASRPARATRKSAPAAPATTTPATTTPSTATSSTATSSTAASGTATSSTAASGTATSGTATARAGRRKPPSLPKVSFTVSSTGAIWSVNATRGAKGVAKNVPVPPGVVTQIADLLRQPGLIEAVADINETAWAEAQARADQLRAELDQLEAVLAAHRSPG